MNAKPCFEGPLQNREFLSVTEKPVTPLGTRSTNRTTTIVLAITTTLIFSVNVKSVATSGSGGFSAPARVKEINTHPGIVPSEVSGTQDLNREWLAYIHNLSRETGLPRVFEDLVIEFWDQLTEKTHRVVPIPVAGPTPQDSFMLSWNRGRHHFEVEVFSEGRFEWFYRDRKTDQFEGAEGISPEAVVAARNYLQRLVL